MPRAVAFAVLVTILSPPPARAQEADPWFARDKALHFGVSAGITVGAYAGACLATDHRPTRRAAAIIVGFGAGMTKEVWDLFGPGDASWRDLAWDAIGTATGVLVAAGIDWLYQRFASPGTRPHASDAGAP
jgi:putative lipoprotein